MDSRLRPAILFAALLLVASLVPVPESGAQQVPALFGLALDKWVHAGSYGLLTGLLVWGHERRTVVAVGALAVLAIAYGGGIELLQWAVPSRDISGLDFLANAVGAVLAGVVWAVLGDVTPLAWRPSEQ